MNPVKPRGIYICIFYGVKMETINKGSTKRKRGLTR